ncbi:MAG: hypothetical protein ABIO76_06115, partial [Ginsengibacter sp.]
TKKSCNACKIMLCLSTPFYKDLDRPTLLTLLTVTVNRIVLEPFEGIVYKRHRPTKYLANQQHSRQ